MAQNALDGYLKFEAKMDEWEGWFDGNDKHSITHQILAMIWDVTAYKMVTECWKYAPKDESGNPKLNGMVCGLFNKCFLQSQASAIRRILDKSRPDKPDYISLTRLLRELENFSSLLTRINLIRWIEEKGKYDIKDRQNQIDMISVKLSEVRSDDDCVCVEKLRKLYLHLEPINVILKHMDMYVAHAFGPGKRARYSHSEKHFDMGTLTDAHKRICQVVDCIRVFIFGGGSGSFLPVPQYNQFEHIENPLIDESKLQLIYDKWKTCDQEAEDWVFDSWRKIFVSESMT